MASKKVFHARNNNYLFFNTTCHDDVPITHDNDLSELAEADIWNSNSNSSMETKKSMVPSRPSKKVVRKMDTGHAGKSRIASPTVTCSSLPVNIPDWSKIYREEYKDHGRKDYGNLEDDSDFEEDEEEGDGRVPPHVYLARQRGASFSVHEGRGRTLKGRDLRQVRNAIWKKVGFED